MHTIPCTIGRTIAMLAAIVLTAAVAPATSQAQSIEACYAPKSGSVYRIKAEGTPTQCSKGHAYFSWSTKSEISGLTFLNTGLVTIAPGERVIKDLWCPTNKTPVQVGWNQFENAAQPGHAPLQVMESQATFSSFSKPVGWYVKVYNPTSLAVPFLFSIQCADAEV